MFSDNSNSLIYVHIGKCGGATLGKSLLASPIINKKFHTFTKIHVCKPPILKNASYVIVVRNPIKRAISAFNWRYKLVVEDGIQKNRFKGEYEILTKYKTLNIMAEKLYIGDELNYEVANEFHTIHHLNENISFYLKPLLDEISNTQIFAVFATESLDEDIFQILGSKNNLTIHKNSANISVEKKFLSGISYKNLKKYLSEDYQYVEKLLNMNNSSSVNKDMLLS